MTEAFDADDVNRLRIALGRISRFLDRRSRSDQLTRTQASVLASVMRLGPIRLSELADVEGVNQTMLSRIVAKLEDAGLFRRLPDPADGRVVLVEVTDAGRAEQLRLRTERSQLLSTQLAAMPPARAAELLAALPALESLADELAPRTENR
ncbi:MAG TPA: MarR family transcriptional regulator [Pseudonocardia sp.]|nr:MarR family transcriptional regulator [Pseudonocardia sp.]